jgi:uncharacterized protein (TIGR03437 family)
MKVKSWAALLAVTAASAITEGQTAPVVNPRGVRNEFSFLPAPGTVSPGGLLRISGLNLGPAEEIRPAGPVLPLEVGDPPVQVLINNRPAPLVSVSPSLIVCQAPLELQPGTALLVVRRGESVSRAARVEIRRSVPALLSATGDGRGEAAATAAGELVRLRATGLGRTEPELVTGQPGPADPVASPADPVRVLIDGAPVTARIGASPERAGEFDIYLNPANLEGPGAAIQLIAGGVAANPLMTGKRRGSEVTFLPLPDLLTDPRGLTYSDLRGGFAALSSARTEEGCYPTWLFDFARAKALPQDGCLTLPNRQAASAVNSLVNSPLLVSWLGPLEAGISTGISTGFRILNPAVEAAVNVTLPFPAGQIVNQPDGYLLATGPGAKAARIDPATGDATAVEPPAGGSIPGQPGVGTLIAAALRERELDLGDGKKRKLLSNIPRQAANGLVALVVADDEAGTTNPQVAVLDTQGVLRELKSFPEGWLPLVPPAAPQRPGPGGVTPAAPPRPFTPAEVDAPTRQYYVAARSAAGEASGLVFFPLEEGAARALTAPDGWHFTACTNNIPIMTLELTRRLALFGSRTPETQFRQPCTARGFIEFGFAANSPVRSYELSGQGELNITAGASDMNDFLYGTDSDPSQQGASSTLFVFDSATETSFRMDLPAGVNSFTQPRPFPELNSIAALARTTNPGDAGIVLFDLERGEAQLLPTPEGFASIQFAAMFPAARKLLARGVRVRGGGSQYLLYDIASSELELIPNPPGVAIAGVLPQQAPAPGQPAIAPVNLERFSAKSNSFVSVGYAADRKPLGLFLVRVP